MAGPFPVMSEQRNVVILQPGLESVRIVFIGQGRQNRQPFSAVAGQPSYMAVPGQAGDPLTVNKMGR